VGYWNYLDIADKIFDIKNLVIEDRKNNEYELYKTVLSINQSDSSYKLVLYKGTKIIHTLYPEIDITIWKRPDKFNFIRTVSEFKIDYKNLIKSYVIAYRDKKRIAFEMIIIKNYSNQMESIEIIDKINSKSFCKYSWTINEPLTYSPFDVLLYDHADLSTWEQKILDTYNGTPQVAATFFEVPSKRSRLQLFNAPQSQYKNQEQ
jgi:hypothetical protein